MAQRSYYEILGVSRDATDEEIRKAYRSLARKNHPDVNPNDPKAESRFKDINEAYSVLSDKKKRAEYDMYGSTGGAGQSAGPGPDMYNYGGFGGFKDGDFNSIFESMFGGVDPRMRNAPGQDVEQKVTITLEEAFSGTERRFQFHTPTGQPRTITVKIPPGIETGGKIRIPNEGGPGYAGGRRGDLIINVTIQPHARYERVGNDLRDKVSIDLYDMILGGEVRVPLMGGKSLTLKVPPLSQNGATHRIPNQGMPLRTNPAQRGDLYLRLEVSLPAQLSDEEKARFVELQSMRKR